MSILEGIKSAGSTIKSTASSAASAVKSGASTVASTVKSGASTVVSGVKSGASTVVSTVKSGASSVTSTVKAGASSAKKKIAKGASGARRKLTKVASVSKGRITKVATTSKKIANGSSTLMAASLASVEGITRFNRNPSSDVDATVSIHVYGESKAAVMHSSVWGDCTSAVSKIAAQEAALAHPNPYAMSAIHLIVNERGNAACLKNNADWAMDATSGAQPWVPNRLEDFMDVSPGVVTGPRPSGR